MTMMISFFLTFQFVLGASSDCNKSPDLFITTPGKQEALVGSCLQIPCNFSAKSKQSFEGEIFGVWIKNDSRFEMFPGNVIFNSRDSGTNKNYPLKITGDLKKKNCTTLFESLTKRHTDRYFLRVENGQYKATASCSGFELTVRDSPWSPSINIPAGDLKEHQSVTITCSALTPCPHSPPELTWNLQQDSHRQTEENPDGTFTTKIQQTITLSDTHDGYNISCSARYPVTGGNKTAETEVTLNVSYAPRDTTAFISPSGMEAVTLWGAVAGALIGTAILICGIFILWRLKTKRSALHQPQNSGSQEPRDTVENQDIHYGDIDFSVMGGRFKTMQDEIELQNVVYSQVKVDRTENRQETVDGIYAQVKKIPVNLHCTQ